MQQQKEIERLRNLSLGLSAVFLIVHFYYYCHGAFRLLHLTNDIADRLVDNLRRTGFFNTMLLTKGLVVLFAAGSRIGAGGSSHTPWNNYQRIYFPAAGLILYVGFYWLPGIKGPLLSIALLYAILSISGIVLLLLPLIKWIGHIRFQWTDTFNRANETFPQEERIIRSKYGIHIPARYRLGNTKRASIINIPNCFAGTLILGNPGCGKSTYIFRPVIEQLIGYGFTGFIFDAKYPDHTRLTYNLLLKYCSNYQTLPSFFSLNFDDPNRSHRCNPIQPSRMTDPADATEAAKVMLLALNKTWTQRQGDFFVDSAISFVAANLWFLRKYENGRYCTLPHLIELIQTDYDKLFSVLRTVPEVNITAFVSAYLSHTMEQLEGQVASARIALSALTSPNLYYILSGDDFELDINNPEDPKIVCIGSNPERQMVYGALTSLYITRLAKITNKPAQLPCFYSMDEFSVLYFPGIDSLMATCRSSKIAPVLGIQNISMLRQTYGRDQADVLFNIPGNVICGQENGEGARYVSERIGKIVQHKRSTSAGKKDTTVSDSVQLDYAVPPSRISSLSVGEFVGVIADEPEHKIELKAFHATVDVDFEKINREEANWSPLPVNRELGENDVLDNFNKIKSDVENIITRTLDNMQRSPVLSRLIINKNKRAAVQKTPK
jgi:hypothetical protein